VGYLDESNYLSDAHASPMSLPTELMEQLSGPPVPGEEMVTLPGGIIIKKNTLILLGIVAAVLLVIYWQKKKKK